MHTTTFADLLHSCLVWASEAIDNGVFDSELEVKGYIDLLAFICLMCEKNVDLPLIYSNAQAFLLKRGDIFLDTSHVGEFDEGKDNRVQK